MWPMGLLFKDVPNLYMFYRKCFFVHVTDIFYRVTKNMAASQVIRKLFPRPSFVPPESEVALEKVVFIDGYKSDHYELVSGVVFY